MIRFVMVSVAVIAASAATTGAPGGTASTDSREQAVVPADPLEHLTVPADRLPPGCALAPRAAAADNSRVQAAADNSRVQAAADNSRVQVQSVWSLPVTSNPWIGKDRSLLASIRGRMWGPPLVPDGPPLSALEMRRYSLRSADGFDAGYAAFYYSKPHEETFSVYAVRVADAADMDEVAPRDHLEAQRIRVGRIVGMVFGREDPGDCLTAVNRYLRSLAR